MPEQRKEHPAVSIIVPLYNAEKYIVGTIRSVEEQTFTDWELLLVTTVRRIKAHRQQPRR